MDPATATILLAVIGITKTLMDGGTVTDEQRAQLRDAERLAEEKLVKDIDADLGGGQ